ncbi:MAG: hypothetical protein Q9162_002414 [Coniocarpon cinnabarinum]
MLMTLCRYLKNKYNNSEEQMQKYTTYMTALGLGSGIHFKFTGTIASTLHAHRAIQFVQEEYGQDAAERVVDCDSSLPFHSLSAFSLFALHTRRALVYAQAPNASLHSHTLPYLRPLASHTYLPTVSLASSELRLTHTALYTQYFTQEAPPSSRETLLAALNSANITQDVATRLIDDENEGLRDVQRRIQEQKMNGVDAVPFIVIEGRRRDYTLEGAKDVSEYVAALEKCVKESM